MKAILRGEAGGAGLAKGWYFNKWSYLRLRMLLCSLRNLFLRFSQPSSWKLKNISFKDEPEKELASLP